MKLPTNQIKENLFTSGNEFVENTSYKPYKGDYCEYNGKFFSGKTFKANAIEIVKISSESNKFNSFDSNLTKYFYKSSDSIRNLMVNDVEIKGIYFIPSNEVLQKGETIRYFVKNESVSPILINEVEEENYNNINNPIYLKASLKWNVKNGFDYNEVNKLDSSYMKGIKTFLFS